jgi:hypothetical protein
MTLYSGAAGHRSREARSSRTTKECHTFVAPKYLGEFEK